MKKYSENPGYNKTMENTEKVKKDRQPMRYEFNETVCCDGCTCKTPHSSTPKSRE
jgi:hypothetical protein